MGEINIPDEFVWLIQEFKKNSEFRQLIESLVALPNQARTKKIEYIVANMLRAEESEPHVCVIRSLSNSEVLDMLMKAADDI